jgi:hypothetical protein
VVWGVNMNEKSVIVGAYTNSSKINSVVKIAIPQTLSLPLNPVLETPLGDLPMSFLKRIGNITDIWTALGKFTPGRFECRIKEGSAAQHNAEQFVASPWVAKNPGGSILRAFVTLEDDTVIPLYVGGDFKLITGNRHIQTFDIESPVVQGWCLKQILSIYSNLDHVEFKLALNWHDRSNPSYNVNIKEIRLECNDEFVIYHQGQLGIPRPTYNPLIDTWSCVITSGIQQILDGAGIEVRGFILALPEDFISFDSDNVDTEARVENLNAIRFGPSNAGGIGGVYAIHSNLNYNSNWFNSNLPNSRIEDAILNPKLAYQPSIFSARTIGMAKTPYQSGAQNDFGADKGYEATVLLDPIWMSYAIGGLVDRLRPYNIHEPNGGRVTKELHPTRVTWNLVTLDSQSKDFLGKTKWAPRGLGTGWVGYDNQHRSQNLNITYYALTGDELELDTLSNALEADLQQAVNQSLADREIGRTFNCWAKMLRILPASDRNRLLPHVETKINELLSFWRGRLLSGPEKTVKCSQIIKDPRGIINPTNGKQEVCWLPYQHAQMIQGVYSMIKALQLFGRNNLSLESLLKDLCITLVDNGFANHGSEWYPILFLRYRTGLESGVMVDKNSPAPEEGIPLPPETFTSPNWQAVVNTDNQGWWDWVSPALSIAKTLPIGSDRVAKIDTLLSYAYPNVVTDIHTLEWFATPM